MSLLRPSPPLPLLYFPKPPVQPRTCLRSIPKSASSSHDNLLQTLALDDPGTHLPAVRSYENDLCRLTLTGPVGAEQALTAAAADGGDAAEEHVRSGLQTMVVETVFPGRADERSTVSTRLFLPADKVKEKARKLQGGLKADLVSGKISRNILAMTFRQVVVQHMWNFELVVFPPGSERNMEDLANPREVPAHFAIGSSDIRVLSVIAEVVCSCALDSVERENINGIGAGTATGRFDLFQKPVKKVSADSSVSISRFSESAVAKEARRKINSLNSAGRKLSMKNENSKHKWWELPSYQSVNKNRSSTFSSRENEYVPSYVIEIDGSKFKNTKLELSQDSASNRWEVLLTHYQLVELANILDMFFEDRYTIPEKQLTCPWVTRSSNPSKEKTSPWRMLTVAFTCGLTLVSFGVLVRIHSFHLFKPNESLETQTSVSAVDISSYHIQSSGAAELEPWCTLVVTRVRDVLGKSEAIMVDRGNGAWIGKLPSNLMLATTTTTVIDPVPYVGKGVNSSLSTESRTSHTDTPARNSTLGGVVESELPSAQDIASYQVVLGNDGEIIGFQPTNRIAVNSWATNPLTKVLYGGKELSPGVIESSLKIPQPDRIILIELLMSVNPESWFVLARPVQ